MCCRRFFLSRNVNHHWNVVILFFFPFLFTNHFFVLLFKYNCNCNIGFCWHRSILSKHCEIQFFYSIFLFIVIFNACHWSGHGLPCAHIEHACQAPLCICIHTTHIFPFSLNSICLISEDICLKYLMWKIRISYGYYIIRDIKQKPWHRLVWSNCMLLP